MKEMEISNRRTSHEGHGRSDIRDLPRYREWKRINTMRTWRSMEDEEAWGLLPPEKKRGIESRNRGFDVEVTLHLSPDGKFRAYCHYCKSENCIHAWQGIQGELKMITINILESELGDLIEAVKKYREISREEKERIFKLYGIDVKDLRRYISKIEKKNKKKIDRWFGKDGSKDLKYYP